MSKRRVLKKAVFLFAALLTALGGLVSCVPEAGEVAQAGPGAWIDFPRDGANIPAGSSVTVVSHAYMPGGVSEVMLSVNGTPYRRDPPEEPGVPFTEARQEWVAQAPGLHTLQVRAYDAAGTVVSSASITVRVEGEAIEAPTEVPPTGVPPTGVPPTEVPPTEVPPTEVPPTEVPPTAVPPTEVPPTAVPPTEVPPTAVPPTEVPPTNTPPPDTDPPPVPEPAVPADGLVISCTSTQVLAWLPVTDPSGVVYDIQLEKQITATTWESASEWVGVAGKQVEAEIGCGLYYRWRVRARDGAGNASAWSSWYLFSVDLI